MRKLWNNPASPKEILSWAMYDFANSSYTTVVITAFYSSFFTLYIVPQGVGLQDSYWSVAMILSTIVALLLAPLVGVICDYSGHKKRYLFASTLICATATMGFYFVGPGDLYLAMMLLIVSNIAFMLSESFCASFLPEIAAEENMGAVSGMGWGIGYFGGLASVAIVYMIVTADSSTNFNTFLKQNQMAMFFTGVFFLVSALPALIFVKNRAKPRPGYEAASFSKLITSGWDELKNTSKIVAQYPALFRFFLAFMIYMAGLDAVIKFVGIYARGELNFSMGDLTLMFLYLQISAAAGALGFGFLESYLGAKNTVLLTLVWWIVAVLAIFFLGSIASSFAMEARSVFMGICLIAGAGIGAIQSSSRAVVGKLCKKEHSAQIFGFWGLFMRLGAILGASYGFVSDYLDSRRFALLIIVGFFAFGALLLLPLKLENTKAHFKAE